MCLSGYLLLPESLLAETSEANQNLPVFQVHGSEDPMVSRELGRRGYNDLVEAGHRVDWHEYPMAHQVCLEEVRDIGRWLAEILKH
jgi:phospholipase/carboxylesterase